MKNNTIEISIVIVSYNVLELLKKCLISIQEHTTNNVELILVDNDSKDDTVQYIQQFFPEVTVIANKENLGFPKANNQAFKIANGKYIFMLNPDTEFKDNALSLLFNKIEKDNIDIIAPRLLNTDLSLQHSVWRNPNLVSFIGETIYLPFLSKKKNYNDIDKNNPFEADTFSGAAILFKKTIIEKIGMLDEKLFWIEDVDFCYRAKNTGLKLLYYPQAEIIHHIGQSAKKNYNISISNQIFNKIKFFKKHYSKTEWLIVTAFSFINCLIKVFVLFLLSPFGKIYFRKAKAYAYTLPKVFNPPIGIQ